MAERSVVVTLRANVTDFKRQVGSAATDLDTLAKKAGQTQGASATALGRMTQSAQLQRESWNTAGTALAGFGVLTVGALGASAKAAVDWETAFAGVMKTVDETATTTYADIEDSLRGMARELPATHQEIAAVAEAAGQLGVATDDITGFTETMIALGETTNLTSDEAATSIAQISNVMGTMARDGAEGVERFASSLVLLGNNGASTERDILNLATRLSSTASVIGMSEADVLGYSNALASVGINAEAGGTAMSRVFMDIAKSVALGGEDVKAFADIAGQSAGDFTTAFEEDPARAVASFIGGLGDISEAGGNVFGTLSDLGMSDIRVSQALLTMAESGDLLTESLDMGAEAWEENGALQDEFAVRLETTAAQLDIAKNNIVDAGISMGSVFLPPIAAASEAVADFFGWISDLPAPIQTAVGGLGALAGGASLAAGAFLLVFPRVLDTMTALQTIGAISPTATKNLGRFATSVGRLAGGATIIAGITIALGALANELHDGGTAKDVEGIADEFDRVMSMGRDAGSVNLAAMFEDVPEFAGMATMETKSLRDALQQLADPSATEKVSSFFGRAGLPSYMEDTAEAVAIADDAMASMVTADNLSQMQSQLDGMGLSSEEIAERMPATTAAIEAVAAASEAADPAMDGAAGSAEALAGGMEMTEEETDAAAEALKEWLELVSGADASFINLLGAYSDVIAANSEASESYDGVTVSLQDFIAELEKQAEAQARWEENILLLSGRVSQGFLNELIAMEAEGAPLVADIVDASDDELARLEVIWGERAGNATDAFAATLLDAAPVMAAAANQLGEDAAEEIAASLASGEKTIQQVIEEYDLEMPVSADTAQAEADVAALAGETPPLELTADPRLAREILGGLLLQIDGSTGQVTMDGDYSVGAESLDEFLGRIGLSSEDVTIDGDPVNGDAMLQLFVNRIRNSEGDVTIDGDNAEGAAALRTLVDTINRARGVVQVDANTGNAHSALNALVNGFNGRRVTVYGQVKQMGQAALADGGVMEFYGSGGVRENHVAQIAPAGTWRVWAEPETGGEAYIPLAASKRQRSEAILEDVAGRFGMGLTRFANGGVADYRPAPQSTYRSTPASPALTFPSHVTLVDESGGILARARVVADQQISEDKRRVRTWS